MTIHIRLTGDEALMDKLSRLAQYNADALVIKNATQMQRRALKKDISRGGTPVSTEETRPGGVHGELRASLHMDTRGESTAVIGYTKEYAAHVEYGHRTVNGGYVEGQRYLQNNVKTQEPIFIHDLKKRIKEL